MDVLVLGGGVIGVTTAYYLSRAGADVTVVERHSDVGQETSFANAGQISAGYSTPWAAPGIPIKALKWLFQRHAPLRIHLDGSLFQFIWTYLMLRECTANRYKINKERMMRISEYSRDCLIELRSHLNISYDSRSKGTLQVFRTKKQLASVYKDTALLDAYDIPYTLISDPQQLATYEPALAGRTDLSGGLHIPNDETGDCYKFTRHLYRLASDMGVKFLFDTDISHINIHDARVSSIALHGNTSSLRADKYVVALGTSTRGFLQPIGISVPIYPVKGYSLTIPIVDEFLSPISTVMDETYKIAITRLNHHIRVGGMAELTGYNYAKNATRKQTLSMVVRDLFPGGNLDEATFWTGLRPMTPDSTPIIGRTQYDNLFINSGHGTLGWTMAAGSGKLLSDIIMDKKTSIYSHDLALSRYS